MKTIDIKGKPYVTVSERVKALRKKLSFNVSIVTEIHTITKETAIVKASLIDDSGRVISTGYAKEDAGDSFINKGSHLENCETSAVGRCLAFAGYGIDAEIASADEVVNSDINTLITDQQKATIDRMLHDSILDEKQKTNIENSLFEMTYSRANDCIEYLSNNVKDPENMAQKDIQNKLDEKLNDPKA